MPETAEKLAIVLWDDPVLSQMCEKVEDNEFGPKLESFGYQLLAAMDGKNGLGLAAPQVGIAKRMFVMRSPEQEHVPMIVVNPILDLAGRTVQAREGCLSMPNVFEAVVRAENAVMKFQDIHGHQLELPLVGFGARVAQHEFDHLNGIMFFDYQDKRPEYGARMSKQLSKHVLRTWEKEKKSRGL